MKKIWKEVLYSITERFYSYREFAKIAGISRQTLLEFIKKNKVHVNSAGQVPESEVEYFIRRKRPARV